MKRLHKKDLQITGTYKGMTTKLKPDVRKKTQKRQRFMTIDFQ